MTTLYPNPSYNEECYRGTVSEVMLKCYRNKMVSFFMKIQGGINLFYENN